MMHLHRCESEWKSFMAPGSVYGPDAASYPSGIRIKRCVLLTIVLLLAA